MSFVGLTICIILSGCGEVQKAPFTTGSYFAYATAYTSPDGRITKYDTLSFTIQEKDITSHTADQMKIRWENTKHSYYQIRRLNTEDNHVELQLPTNYGGFENENIAIAGHPTVHISQGVGYRLDAESTYTKGYGKLAWLTMKQHTAYLRDTTVEFDGMFLRCQLIERYNTSHIDEFGKYSLVFTYNATYGFMTMSYTYPNGKHISFRLIDVEINARKH